MTPVVSKYHADNVRAIKTLDPVIRPLFYEFLVRIAAASLRCRITAAFRTEQEQDAEYAKGRTAPGPVVTFVEGKDSWHCWGLAVDIAPLSNPIFRLTNGVKTALYNVDYSLEAQIARIAHELGITWGFAVWGFDKPHFMYTGGLSIEDLKRGKFPAAPEFSKIFDTLDLPSQMFFAEQKQNLERAGLLPL